MSEPRPAPLEIGTTDLPRDDRGHVQGDVIYRIVCERLAVEYLPPDRRSCRPGQNNDIRLAFCEAVAGRFPALPAGIGMTIFRGSLGRCGAAVQRTIAEFLGLDAAEVWPLTPAKAKPDLLQTALAIRIAIDALPVGKDIRTRLLVHVNAHITAIEALARP